MRRRAPPGSARESPGGGRGPDPGAGAAEPAFRNSRPAIGGRPGTLPRVRRRSAPGRAQPYEKPFAGPEVGDAGGLDPAPRRLEDAPLHAPELARVVRVGADDEGYVHAAGPKKHFARRVEPREGRVDLHSGAPPDRLL